MIYSNITEIKPNPKNPRVIKDEKFDKLVQSLKDFPEMLEKRPLVVFTDTDGKYVVLGGNMRLKAAKNIGLKKLPIIIADDWTEEQKNQFLIKDNVGFGEWDWNELKLEWDTEQLENWGLELPHWENGHEVNTMNENDLDLTEEFDPIGVSKNQQRIVIIFDDKESAESWINQYPTLKEIMKKMNMAWQINLCTQSTLSVKEDMI